MKFEKLLENISKIKKKELLGESIQLEMSPNSRGVFSQNFKTEKTRKAAVLMLLYPKGNETYLGLILRTKYDGVHSGQVALPGGKYEDYDKSLWYTALRETYEEIGVPISNIEKIKDLTTIYIPASDFRVYPFLAKTERSLKIALQAKEVAEFIEMPIAHLLNGENKSQKSIKYHKGETEKVPCFDFESYKIWGATAMMLNELKQLLIESMEL